MDGVERIMVLGIFAVIVSILAVAAWSVTQDDLATAGVTDGGTPPVVGTLAARSEHSAPLGSRASADELLAQFEAHKAERQTAQNRLLVRPERPLAKQPELAKQGGIDTSKPSSPYSNGPSSSAGGKAGRGSMAVAQGPSSRLDDRTRGGGFSPSDKAEGPLALKANGTKGAGSGRPSSGTRKIRVNEGDTLWGIVSRGVAGDASMADKVAFICRLNGNMTASQLKIDQLIVLPFTMHAETPANVALPAVKTKVNGASSSSSRLYTVVEGDSLSRIAKHLLGRESRYQEIFELNKDRLASASEIRVGMTLRVPAK